MAKPVGIIDLVGRTYGNLTVLALAERISSTGQRYWLCRCICGREKAVRSDALKQQVSCGCIAVADRTKNNTKHGRTSHILPNGDSTYRTWRSMRQRCLDPKTEHWEYYGAKGVAICNRWRDSFNAFVDDMGERPFGMTLDRIDPFGNYEPANCRWADVFTQNNNQRRHAEKQRSRTDKTARPRKT